MKKEKNAGHPKRLMALREPSFFSGPRRKQAGTVLQVLGIELSFRSLHAVLLA